VEPGRGTFDADLDMLPRRVPPPPREPVENDQRLVANPVLGVLFWIITFAFMRESLRRHNLPSFVWATLFLLVGIVFLQYHCLDCGSTGCLLRARLHACPAVVARRDRRGGRRRGLAIKTQLAAWFFVIVAALVLGMVALGSRR
jgi:hypothetical protein